MKNFHAAVGCRPAQWDEIVNDNEFAPVCHCLSIAPVYYL